jgi:hypothetical protein
MYLIPWEEGFEGLDILLLEKNIKSYVYAFQMLHLGITLEINEMLLCKKRGTYKNK